MSAKRVGHPEQALSNFVEGKKATAPKAVLAAGLFLEGRTKEVLSTPGTGRIRAGGKNRVGKGSFRRDKDGKLHVIRRGAARVNIDNANRASAPGEPPAPDTGDLRNSITHDVISPLLVRVGTNVVYAAPLEFGTTKIAPRPFMRRAFAEALPLMSDEVIGVLSTGRPISG